MKVEFIGQGYNSEIDSSVAKTIIELLADNNFSSFKCLVAFASRSGISALSPHIEASKHHLGEFQIVVGIDQQGTSKEALEEIIEWKVDSYVYYTSQRIIFHPKIYLFEGENNCTLIVGSNNLTLTGLAQNIEGSVRIDFDKKQEDGANLLGEINKYFESIFLRKDSNLKPLDLKLIERLLESGLLPTEKQRTEVYAKVGTQDDGETKEAQENLFNKIKIQSLPKGFSPSKNKDLIPVKAAEVVPESEIQIDGSTFLMTLQKTDVGVGQTTKGTSRRSPEIFIPLSARNNNPEFWGWDDKFSEDSRKPGKFDRAGVRMRIGTDIHSVNMMTWPDKSDFRLRSEALRSAGQIDDILKIETSNSENYEYVVSIISKGDKDYTEMLSKCDNLTRNSKKLWGYI